MRDYYTLKEILLGLRNEQLRVANMLEKLNSKLEIYNDSRYKKSEFTFSENNTLIFYLKEKNTLLQNVIYAITLRLEKIKLGDFSFESIRSLGDGNYKIGGIGGMKVSVKKEEQESFNELINKILNDEFVRCSNLQIYGKKISDYHKNLCISPIRTKYNGYFDYIDSISFRAKHDEIGIVTDKKIRNDEKYIDDLKKILGTRFSRNDFPIYIQNIIDNSKSKDKEIVLLDNKPYRIFDVFSIDEKPNNFALVKKVNKKR